MAIETKDLIRLADGDFVRMELYQQALREAGIESHVVGDELNASIGTAIPQSMELWVRAEDAENAAATIKRMESERGHAPIDRPEYERPDSDPKPHNPATHGPHTHYDADPRS